MANFKVKARAVDLLGKDQIADLPTAISELWKNGYDAYADNLLCNLYESNYKSLKSPLFTLSDDGTGMSEEDLQNKWIVLGTDSKVRGTEALTADERLGKPRSRICRQLQRRQALEPFLKSSGSTRSTATCIPKILFSAHGKAWRIRMRPARLPALTSRNRT